MALEIVEIESGYRRCYGCAKCTSGCPVADRMDIKPHQVMRLLQVGEVEPLLAANGPWKCVRCQTCLSRCPNEVDIPSALAQLRVAALAHGQLAQAGKTPVFDDLVLQMLKSRGRMNDGLLAFRLRLKTGGLFDDWQMGIKILMNGKMKLRSPSIANRKEMARLFEPQKEPGGQ